MNETDYNARLYEKMKAEQDKYRDWLLHQEPSEILNHTYLTSGMLLKRARKSVRYGRTRRQTASGSVPPSHSAISRTHRIRRTGW